MLSFPELERLPITLTPEVSEVVRGALCDWKVRREIRHEEITALKADIDQDLAQIATGRLTEFDAIRSSSARRNYWLHTNARADSWSRLA